MARCLELQWIGVDMIIRAEEKDQFLVLIPVHHPLGLAQGDLQVFGNLPECSRVVLQELEEACFLGVQVNFGFRSQTSHPNLHKNLLYFFLNTHRGV